MQHQSGANDLTITNIKWMHVYMMMKQSRDKEEKTRRGSKRGTDRNLGAEGGEVLLRNSSRRAAGANDRARRILRDERKLSTTGGTGRQESVRICHHSNFGSDIWLVAAFEDTPRFEWVV